MTKLNLSQINYPRKIDKNIEYRATLIEAASKDKDLIWQIHYQCTNDIIFWLDTFCWTYNPRSSTRVLPWICYESYQIDYIYAIQEAILKGHDILTEKSRDMGVSWMVLYVFQHFWLFFDHMDFLLISEKEDKIDTKGDVKSLFEKLRFNLRYHPKFLLPKTYEEGKHATYMKIYNPVNRSVITGETSNPDAGRSGRCNAVLIDESAFCSHMNTIWTSLADTTNCRIPVSTPNGSGNKFAMLANEDTTIRKCTLHWTLHPDKAKSAYYFNEDEKIDVKPEKAFELWKSGVKVRSPWYDNECTRRTAQEVAQELDIDYLASGSPFFDINSLSKQVSWEYYWRQDNRLGHHDIPHGKYIRANIREMGNVYQFVECQEGIFRIYEYPRKDGQYVLSMDTSEGLPKGDESFGVVRDKYTLNVVADWNYLKDPEEFALDGWQMAQIYPNCRIAPENNNHGYTTSKCLNDLGCDLYYTKKVDSEGKLEKTTKRGLTTTLQTRPLMLDYAKEEIHKNICEVRSPIILSQMQTFVRVEKKGGRPEADGEFKDDGVMAYAIGSYVIREEPFNHSKQLKDKKLPDAIIRMNDDKKRGRVKHFGRKR